MRISFYLILLSFGFWTKAQIIFPKTPTKFMAEYKTQVLKSASDTQIVILNNFESIWLGETFTPFQKKTTMKSIQLLANKSQPAVPTMWQVGHILTLALNRNATEKQIDTLVQIFEHSFEKNEPKQTAFLLKTLESYLAKNILFQDNIVTVYVEGDNFNFSLIAESSDDYDGGYDFEETGTDNGFDGFDAWDNEESEPDFNSYDDVDWGSNFDAPIEEAPVQEEFVVYAEEMPYLSGGILKLNNVNLIIQTALDTVSIKETSGSFSLNNGEFIGEGGSFDWTLVGLDPSIQARFKSYHFSVKKPELMVEDVLLYYADKVSEPVQGIFEYKYQKRKPGTPSSYPRFMSYQNKVAINGLSENFEYLGGFAMNGSRIFSSCVLGTPSIVKVKNDGELKFKAMAPYFELSDSLISSKPTKVVLYFADGDSITHPGVQLKYNDETKNLLIRKDVTSYKDAAFSNSFHNLEMDVDQIKWNLEDTVMTMDMMGAKLEVPAFFESILLFDETKYIHLKGIYPFHPLQMIMYYCKTNKTTEFSVNELAISAKQNEFTIRTSIASLENKGLVKTNPKTGMVSLTDKAFHYYYSRLNKKDYDIISVKSLAVTKPEDPSSEPIQALPYNAQLNLNNYDLKVLGVDKVVLSDSNDVRFYPSDRTIIFQKNRDIKFNGIVTTNNYVFNGREFTFNYDTFSIKLEHIDSIEFSIEVFDSITGETKREKMDNNLSYSKGTLTIDEPNNKSGLKVNPKYPHFDANHGASVYFNKQDILNGVYDTTFRYQIPPFAVDSLSGDMEKNISFDGEFFSGDVFPVIHEKLEVMGDKGFGFSHQVPEEGYPLYGGMAKFYGKLTMGKNGLRGDGKIVFLNTTLESMDFVFYKDSVKGLGDIAITKAGTNPKTGPTVTFPKCEVTDYEMEWYPRSDSMRITNYDNAFKLYNNEVDLSGALIITTKGMKGTGLVETNGSLTISKNVLFKERSFSATKGQFEILTNVVGKPALRSDYVNVEMDLDKKQAWFSPAKEGYASNNFPYLKFKTSLNDGFWDIEKKIVSMEKPKDMDIKDSYFYSTKASQDSLAFNAERAFYYIDSLKLKVEGVGVVRIADALVYLDGNRLEIKENAKISNLKNVRIVMDTINEYHTLVNGEIELNSRTDLDGHASYSYVNFEEDTLEIRFSDFKLEALKNVKGEIEYHTVARGTILEEDSFMVAPQMMFKGEVSMFAHRRLLSMDGYIKLDLHGKIESPNWLRYENSEDVDEIRIDLESKENKDNAHLISGVHYSASKNDYYCTFLDEKQSLEDQSIFMASGYLIHDLETKEFEVIDKDRFDNKFYTGNLFGYLEETERYDLNGTFNFINKNPEIPHHYTFNFGGAGVNNILDSTFDIKGLASLKFEIPSQILDIIGAKLQKMSAYLPPNKTIRFGDSLYHAVGDIVGQKEALKYVNASSKAYVPLHKTVKFFSEGFTLNDLELYWNKKQQSWHTKKPIGFVNVGDHDLNLYLKSYFEIKKTSSEDQINFYIEATPELWYYFTYSANGLFIYTSDVEVSSYVQTKNTELKNLPKGLYYWTTGDEEQFNQFKKRFVESYLKGKDIKIDYTSIPVDVVAPEEFEDEFKKKKKEKKPIDEFEEKEVETETKEEFKEEDPFEEEFKEDEFDTEPKDEFEEKPEVTETDEFEVETTDEFEEKSEDSDNGDSKKDKKKKDKK